MCIFQKEAHKKWMHSTSVLQSRSSLQLWGRNHTQKLWTVDIVLPWTSWWVYWWCCCYHCGAFGDLRPITVELKHNYVSNCAPCLQWVLWLWEKGTNQRPMFFLQAKYLLKHKYTHAHTKRANRDASLAVLFWYLGQFLMFYKLSANFGFVWPESVVFFFKCHFYNCRFNC